MIGPCIGIVEEPINIGPQTLAHSQPYSGEDAKLFGKASVGRLHPTPAKAADLDVRRLTIPLDSTVSTLYKLEYDPARSQHNCVVL